MKNNNKQQIKEGQYVVDTTSKQIFKFTKRFAWMIPIDMIRKATESEKKSIRYNKNEE